MLGRLAKSWNFSFHLGGACGDVAARRGAGVRARADADAVARLCIGFGRIVVSEEEVLKIDRPSMVANFEPC
jgi:hypothetical protein